MRRAIKFLGFLLVGMALLTGLAYSGLMRITRQWFDKDIALRSILAVTAARRGLSANWSGDRRRLGETLTDIKKPLREALLRLRGLAREKGGAVSRREIREALHVPDSTVRRWLQELVDFEYLGLVQMDGEKGGQGKTVRYRLLEREAKQSEVLGLLSPAELRLVLGGRA